MKKLVLLTFLLSTFSIVQAQIAGGIYSIGAGEDYETLVAALTDINTNGISGNVTLELVDGHVEDAYLPISNYPGNFDFELTIRPEAGATSVQLISSANSFVIELSDATNVIIDGRAGGVGEPVMEIKTFEAARFEAIRIARSASNVQIKYCKIQFGGWGIATNGNFIQTDILIENCVFSTPEITTPKGMYAVFVVNGNVVIRNNSFQSPNLNYTPDGISAYSAIRSRSIAEIYNNFISVGHVASDELYGIHIERNGTAEISHNTIAFQGGSASNVTNSVFPLFFNHGSGVTIQNNIIYNGFDCDGDCNRGAIKFDTFRGGSLALNDNAIGVSTSNTAPFNFYFLDGESANILENFPNNNFVGSGSFNFVDFQQNDLTITESTLNSTSVFRTSNDADIATDIFGNARNPSIKTKGAVESPFSDGDNNIYTMSAPELSSITLQDIGNSGRINIEVENPTTDLTFTPTFTLAPGATIDPEGGQPFDYSRVANFTVFFDVTAANGIDAKRWILSVTGTNRWPAGTYSVGTGGDFEDLESASNSFAIFGIEGDVTLELKDGYSANWDSFFQGAGIDEHTITIRPEVGATEIAPFFQNVGGRHLIIDGRPGGVGQSVLSFKSLRVNMFSGASSAQIRYVKFLRLNGINSGNLFGLQVRGGTGDVLVEHCEFNTNGFEQRGTLQGLIIDGAGNARISNNKFYNIEHNSSGESRSIDVLGEIGKIDIVNNSISLGSTRALNIYGIQLNNQVTGEVNILHNTINIGGTSSGNTSAMLISGDPSSLKIKNNMVSLTGGGSRTGLSWTNGSGTRDIDFNNISGIEPIAYNSGDVVANTADDFKSNFINSSSEDVTFTNASVGDLSLSASLNNNSQVRTVFDASLPEDINGTTRSSFPMKGAYDAPGSGFNDILSLNFEGASGLTLDAENATVSVDADPALDRSNLAVDITIPPGAFISPDPSVGQDYTTPMTFTVTSENDIDKTWMVTMQDAQVAPSGLSLSTNDVVENTPTNTTFATFVTTDGNSEDTHTYELVAGEGDDRNNRFTIVDNGLQSTAGLNFEGFNTLSIRVRTTDNTGLSFEKALIIEVTDINEAPEDLYVDENEWDEGIAANTAFTDLLVDDEDEEDSFTFSFVSGDGDSDNDKFDLDGANLITLVDFDFESQNEFSIRVRVTDLGGLMYESIIEIFIYDIEEVPTNITLSSNNIDENSPPGTVVANLSTEDDDEADTHTYSLVVGDGAENNNAFQISGDQLLNEGDLNFETKSSYNIRIQTDDGNGGTFEKAFIISINNVNEAPTDISLANSTVDESNPVGTLIGLLDVTDEDLTDNYTYSLKGGVTDNESFGIDEDQLVTTVELDFETKASYTVEVIVTDQGGLTFEKAFIITVNDLPAQITSIVLDGTTINENEATNSAVGNLSSFGEDLSGSYTYTFAAGTGDEDNASFSLSGDQLLTSESFNFEAKSIYSILIMSDDGSLTGTQVFTISINDVNEAPTDMDLVGNSIMENNTVGEVIGSLSATDEDAGNSFTYSLVAGVGDTDNAAFSFSGDQLLAATVFDFEAQSSYTVRVETNDGNGGTYQESFTIEILNENESIVAANPIADQELDEGFSSLEIDLAAVFVDTDGDVLSFSVSSSNTAVVTVNNTVSTLTITEVGGFGSSTITVTADDGSGVTTSDAFEVTVVEVNEAPIVANSFPDGFGAPEGFGMTQINYGDVFSDPDGDELTITVSSSDKSVVTVELILNNQFSVNEVGVGVSTITVTATDGDGASASDTFTFTVTEAPLGFEDEIAIEVYPNPATDFVNIHASEQMTIYLTNSKGQSIQSDTGQAVRMNVSELSSGVYFLRITNGESTTYKRIIKAN
ncbi:cadherin domain-containing protein [Ekhidna sp.]